MAAPMRVAFAKNILKKASLIQHRNVLVRYSGSTGATEDVAYPPIKPMYPPGAWGEITPKKAWQMYEVRETLMSKPTAKWRLEEMAGVLPGKHMWLVNAVDAQPRTLPYKQYITKTHLEKRLPDWYKSSDDLLQTLVNRVRSQIEDVILLEEELVFKERSSFSVKYHTKLPPYYRQRIARQIFDVLINNACYDVPHLHDAQIDANGTVESFWHRIGCGADDDMKTLGRYTYGAGRLWFQGSHKFCLQLRTELPLPEALPMDDPLCSGEVPDLKYSPAVFGIQHLKRRSFNISGHWQEDPCEFVLLSVSVPNFPFDHFVQKFGERFYDDTCTNYGMTAAFLSCAAQAHNQGFNWLMDLTYPFTHQSIVTDGRWFQFMTYQLNTLRMWVDDNAHALRNICWTTDRHPLYNTIENGHIRGFNEDVLKMLYKYVLMKPQDRGINLRPYLPEELPPGKHKQTYINFKGEEPFPFTEKPGQHEYPRNSAYFQQNI